MALIFLLYLVAGVLSVMSELQQMIEDCQDREHKLSEWEVNFIASLDESLGKGKNLTEKQEEKLNTIWDRVTS